MGRKVLNPKHPQVVAHRGGAHGDPQLENKLPAFEQALALGVDMLECDVHLSADNEVVVVHDETLQRTTAGHGPVNAHTASELATLGVPTLRELCRMSRGKARLLIEIKSASPYRVLEVIEKEKMARDVMMFSFDIEYLRPIARLRPDIELAFLLEHFTNRVPDTRAFIAAGREIKAVALAPSVRLAKPTFVKAVHKAGLQVFVWTANTARDQRAVLAAKADAIISDFPDRLLAFL